MRVARAALPLVAMSFLTVPALAGPDWIEGGFFGGPDAGSIIGTAQEVTGSGPLATITGSLSEAGGITGDTGGGLQQPDYEDMYLIRINQPSTFSFKVVNAQFDAQLFLFNITLPGQAFGLLANLDSGMGNMPEIIRPATDGSGADVLLPGVYALAISGAGRLPVSNAGQIFFFQSQTEISGPDGPGGINPHTGWTGTGQVGSYDIELRDVGWYDVPAPGSALLLAGAGLFGARRRR